MKNLLITIFLNILILNILSAQDGRFMAGAFLDRIDCESGKAYIDLKIKAENSNTHFYLAEQNYRLSFNRSAFVPGSVFIERELEISGVVEMSGDTIVYSNHTLLGSSDTIISYNIELLHGEGYPLTSDEWTSVGRIGLDIADINECFKIRLHGEETFPPTYVGELFGGTFHSLPDGSYTALEGCFSDYCNDDTAEDTHVSVEQFIDYKNNIQVLPTVVQNELTVRYTLPQHIGITRVTIADMQGQILQGHKESLTGQDVLKFDVSRLSQGIYLINTLIDGQWITQKFVKV